MSYRKLNPITPHTSNRKLQEDLSTLNHIIDDVKSAQYKVRAEEVVLYN